MPRTFRHDFDPAHLNLLGAQVQLTSAEIEQAGILEILQAPGARLMTGAILDSLLSTTSRQFIFSQQLGHAREVKVAISGLLGRFVARAYLTRHYGYSHFYHVSVGSMMLSRRRRVHIKRLAKGDLPDWIIHQPGATLLAVAEAKGCHDPQGPQSTLNRAWSQAQRINVHARSGRLPIKRYAITTRWGIEHTPLYEPIISVRDPEEPGDASPEDIDIATVSVVRGHVESLLRGLGHDELANSIMQLRIDASGKGILQDQLRASALSAFDAVQKRRLIHDGAQIGVDQLIGGIVTRAGRLKVDVALSLSEQEALSKMDLGATFVGLDAQTVRAAIDGSMSDLKVALEASAKELPSGVGTDKAGTWIRRLEKGYLVAKSS